MIGDAVRLQRILSHLIDNAVKFCDSGVVQLQVEPGSESGDGWICFTVSDQGPGVTNAQRERIFEPFVQGNSALSRTHEGVGLGLAICRKLAESMGGSVSLSPANGVGASFKLQLLLPECRDCGRPVPVAGISQEKPVAGDSPKPCVLVAEDDPINFKLAKTFLRLLGMDCVRAKHGLEAVEAFTKQQFLVVLMDVQMPVMDGIQATREIRKMDPDHRTPVIALTANVLPEDRERCHAAGMDGFVAKPFKKEDLRRAIESARNAVRNPEDAGGNP